MRKRTLQLRELKGRDGTVTARHGKKGDEEQSVTTGRKGTKKKARHGGLGRVHRSNMCACDETREETRGGVTREETNGPTLCACSGASRDRG